MTVDDCLDYDIDVQVERTKTRPIPRGAITPLRAWQFCSIQTVIGLVMAFKLLNYKTSVFRVSLQTPSTLLTAESQCVHFYVCVAVIHYLPHMQGKHVIEHVYEIEEKANGFTLAMDVLRTYTLGTSSVQLSAHVVSPVYQGLMFNIGIFMGPSELSRENVDWRVLVPLYIGSILWTATYETIYQHLVSPLLVFILLFSSSCCFCL